MARRGLVGRQENSSPSQGPVPLRGRGGSGRLSVSVGATAMSFLIFHPPVPSPWVSPAALSRPRLVPKTAGGHEEEGARVWVQPRALPTALTFALNSPDKLCASPRTPRRDRTLLRPGHLAPRCPPQARCASLRPSEMRGARGAPQPRARLPRPRRR